MALYIAFQKSADSFIKQIVKTLAGPYVHTDIVIKRNNTHTVYSAHMDSSFSMTTGDFSDLTHDFLMVAVSEEELRRVVASCEACVKSRIPYNTQDMILSQVPLRNPVEQDLFNSPALFCAQAVVLILRSCLDPNRGLLESLAAVNSRTVSPSQLYECMAFVCASRNANQVLEQRLRSCVVHGFLG